MMYAEQKSRAASGDLSLNRVGFLMKAVSQEEAIVAAASLGYCNKVVIVWDIWIIACDIWIRACSRVRAGTLVPATNAGELASVVVESSSWFAVRSSLGAISRVTTQGRIWPV